MWIIGFLGFCYLLVYIVFTIFNTHQRNSSQDSQNAKNKLPDYSDLRAIPIDDAEAHALSGNAIPHPVDDHLVTNPKILKQLNNSSHDSKIDFIPDR